ncbi:MAG: hypothetical protein BGO14_11575 [Chlamydiales bacterium 38-26]|nr:hypothetical protein [Chlamydiales bacterium]OJV11581.1 MAG: hypothetical protein BGO14_11575 [Chlamydiales bacterium 38-26]
MTVQDTTHTNHLLARSMLAGSVAHSIELFTLGQILDRIKVEKEARPQLRSIKEAFKHIWKQGEGKEFYKGFRANIALSILKGSTGWGIHHLCNRQILRIYPQKDKHFPTVGFTTLVGCMTGFIETSFILCPLERFKTYEMTSKGQALKNVRIISNSGLKFMYKGWTPLLLRQTVSWASYLVTYQKLRQAFLNRSSSLTMQEKITLSASTGAIVACINAPFDLLKTQLQQANVTDEKMWQKAYTIHRQYGWKGMYRGLTIKLIRNIWSSVCIILTLDKMNAFPANMKI